MLSGANPGPDRPATKLCLELIGAALGQAGASFNADQMAWPSSGLPSMRSPPASPADRLAAFLGRSV